MHSVLFLASENGALPGGKVGGVGDVVRDLPKALAQIGWHVRVATPSYGVLHRLSGSRRSATLPVTFRGEKLEVEVWEVPTEGGVETIVLHHALFEEQGPGRIYFSGDVDRPFATDATKFSLFSVKSFVVAPISFNLSAISFTLDVFSIKKRDLPFFPF